MMEKIAVVGSGPSGYSTYLALKARYGSSAHITLIDSNLRKSENESVQKFSAQKLKFDSAHMFETDKVQIDFENEVRNFTLANGGLSTVWGAGIRLWDEQDLNLTGVSSQRIYDAAQFLLSNLEYSGSNATINLPLNYRLEPKGSPKGHKPITQFKGIVNNEQLSVFTPGYLIDVTDAGCVGCGECLSGCPYGAIFDSGNLFDEKIIKRETTLIVGVVNRIEQDHDSVNIEVVRADNLVGTYNFSRVYLAAGALGTPFILLKSGLISDSIHVQDSQVFYFAGISFFHSRRKKDPRFALGNSGLKGTTRSGIEFSISIYECTKETRLRLQNSLKFPFAKKHAIFPKILDRFLFFGIGFLDSKQSGQLEIDLHYGVPRVREINRTSKLGKSMAVVFHLSKKLFRRGMLVIWPVVQTPPAGSGFHSGAGLKLNSVHVDERGRLRVADRIVVSDTSLLPFVKPGSHTFVSMCLNVALILEKT